MLISTLSSFKQTFGGVAFNVYFMQGAVPDQSSLYFNREALANAAVASSSLVMLSNSSDFSTTAGSYGASKVGAGQTTWIADNSSQIVIPQSIVMPAQDSSPTYIDASVKSINNRYLMLTPVSTTAGTDKNAVNAGAVPLNGQVVFGFRTATNLTKIQYFSGLASCAIETSVDGTTWANYGTGVIGAGTDVVTASASNVLFVRLTAKVAIPSLTGSFLFFGTEATVQTAPTITHCVLTQNGTLSAEQKYLLLNTYSDVQNMMALQFTCGGPLSSGQEMYANTATVAAGQQVYPVTFTLTGNVLASI